MLRDGRHACLAKKKNLGKIEFRAFPKRVSPQILSLEIVDYFGTNKYFGGRKKDNSVNEKNSEGEANWSGVVNFHCMQIESCDKHSVYF